VRNDQQSSSPAGATYRPAYRNPNLVALTLLVRIGSPSGTVKLVRSVLRVAGVLLGLLVWAAGVWLVVQDRLVVGAILILVGAVVGVIALASHRAESAVDVVMGWLTNLP
jgi:hypothetical protein